ncbi:MAG: adenylate/guanylate cyclase domain-containing protein [Myxococcales bacterium]|nr:adenylate/guanylate cyclase domain-containing protein [Myxococcales bacterium]
MKGLRGFASERRYELVALAIGLIFAGVHRWADSRPQVGLAGSDGGALLEGIELFEGRATDLKFKVRGKRAPHPDLLVVAIDERSIQQFGQWPWPRTLMARALSELGAAGASAVGLDVGFLDEARNSPDAIYSDVLARLDRSLHDAPEDLAGRLSELRAHLAKESLEGPDAALEREFSTWGPKVVHGVFPYSDAEAAQFAPEKRSEHARLIEPHLIRKLPGTVRGSSYDVPVDKLNGWVQASVQTPLERFARTGARMGHIGMVIDADGTLRRVPPLVRLESPKGFLPSMALQLAAAHLGAEVEPLYDPMSQRLTGVRLRREGRSPLFVPHQNNEPFTLLNHVGPSSAFPTASISDVISGRLDRAQVKGKAVLVGFTAAGYTGDQRVTPFRELEPGIYSHASLLSNILASDFLTRPAGLGLGEALAIVVGAVALGFAIPRFRRFRFKALAMGGALFLWVAAIQLAFERDVQLTSVVPLASVLATSFAVVFMGYLSVDREKLRLRATFSKYLDEEVIEEALKDPERLSRGEKREMTVLFSDIRGFTTLAERMLPEKLAEFIKDYLNPMTQIVFEEKGTLDKYIGDAVMAFWNAPLDQPDHALRACRAGLGFLRKLEELKQKWRSEKYPQFDIGVGINSGPMIVGNMGSDIRVDYTVLGDAVHLAARLEGTNKEYDTHIILAEGTYLAVKEQVIARRLGSVRVKGKRKPVRIYELRGLGQPTGQDSEAIGHFEAGLEAYAAQRFDEAAEHFRKTSELWPADPPSRRYLDEIPYLKEHPPGPGWDGVFTATTK